MYSEGAFYNQIELFNCHSVILIELSTFPNLRKNILLDIASFHIE